MNLALRCASVFLVVLVVAISGHAQSASEIRAKYGTPLEAFEIRPHILMTVKFGEGGRICQYVIEARHASQDMVKDESLMANETALEIIDEVVPLALRGRSSGESIFISGCLGVVIKNYENVEIRKYGACPRKRGGGDITSVVINWKHRDCRPK